MSDLPINRRDALRASAGLAPAVMAPSSTSAQTPPQPTPPTAILKSQSLAPLMGAPVELGTAANDTGKTGEVRFLKAHRHARFW
jgi:hypothetical protein